jgi:protein ImuA
MKSFSRAASSTKVFEFLKRSVERLEGEVRTDWGRVSSGSPSLDKILPESGFRRGSLVEWLGETGSGATTMAVVAAREACQEGGHLVLVDCAPPRFHPPAAASFGIDLNKVVIVRPQNEKDGHWAVCQALSCRGVNAVLCWPKQLNERDLRRWQLAAESGGALGIMIRPVQARGRPTWSEVQLLIQPLSLQSQTANRRVRIEVCYCRGRKSGSQVEVEIDQEAGAIREATSLPVVAQLADSTSAQHSARA